MRLKHTLSFMSLVAVYAPTEMCETEEETFYGKLDSVLDQCSLLLNFARSRGLRIAGSWYQKPELHRWTWNSNAGWVAKENDHILVSTRWRILQNCRVFRSAEFFNCN